VRAWPLGTRGRARRNAVALPQASMCGAESLCAQVGLHAHRELELLRSCSHPHVVHLLDSFVTQKDPPQLVLVLELLDRCAGCRGLPRP
jgi:serine/threonine protein kinase